jgi:hypothetical protein
MPVVRKKLFEVLRLLKEWGVLGRGVRGLQIVQIFVTQIDAQINGLLSSETTFTGIVRSVHLVSVNDCPDRVTLISLIHQAACVLWLLFLL